MPPLSCESVRDLIEPLLDGEPMAADRRRELDRHLRTCAACAAEHELARAVRAGLAALPLARCPDRVLDRIRARRGATEQTELSEPPRTERPRGLWLAAAAALLVLGVGGWLGGRIWLQPTDRGAHAALSAEELERAEVEARLALAYFARVSDRVTRIVRDEVLVERVAAAPVRALAELRWPGEIETKQPERSTASGDGEL